MIPPLVRRCGPRAGLAMLTVLLALLALFVMSAPFLLTVRNADHASAELSERARTRVALDSAARHARARLRASHPALDPTPYFDSEEELRVTPEFPPGFLDASDAEGVMWDLEVEDLSARIDLNTAPPQVFANLAGLATRLTRPVKADDAELGAPAGGGFSETGFLWIEGELVSYSERSPSGFATLERGLLVEVDGEGGASACGPRPASAHPAGVDVFDQRAWAVPEWRVRTGAAEPARLDGPDRLLEAEPFALAPFGPEFLEAVAEHTSAWAGEGAGGRWQRGTRVQADLAAGQDCTLRLFDTRWFNPGTTVQLRSGAVTELALVQAVSGSGVTLTHPVANDFPAFETTARPLARRPVNVNTASREVLQVLFEGLSLRQVNARITAAEARALADAVLESRPFEGFRDFAERLVFPAAGIEPLPADAPVHPEVLAAAFLDEDDARALYLNALNANSAYLEFSTMPLAFTSRDVYAMELRAALNARSGVERLRLVRDQVEVVVPQEPLMHVWTRQEDFDLSLRHLREAPYWSTGPESTSQVTADPTTPPSRYSAHFGTPSDEGGRLQTFASRDDDGWAQLQAARVEEHPARLEGRVLHFDRERTDPEGRDLAQRPIALTTTDRRVGWAGTAGLLEPLRFGGWIKPLVGLRDQDLLLDVGERFAEADRISLTAEGGDLVLRVLDGTGDHSGTTFEEVTEARMPLDAVPADTWTHVELDVRGNRPSQVSLFVDGQLAPETTGLTRLTRALGDGDPTIAVESTEGFPELAVLRIGNEIVEAYRDGNTFVAQRRGGEAAGFGGRLARERVLYRDGADETFVPVALDSGNKAVSHPAGTPVELYGYSVPISGAITDVEDRLESPLGAFRVGRVYDASFSGSSGLEPIFVPNPPFTEAHFIGQGLASPDLDGLAVRAADRFFTDAEEEAQWVRENVMPAFSQSGGYLAVVSRPFQLRAQDGSSIGQTSEPVVAPLGGIEVMRYSGWDPSDERNVLQIAERGLEVPVVPGHRFPIDDGDAVDEIGGPVAFVIPAQPGGSPSGWVGIDWGATKVTWNDALTYDVFVFPISVDGGAGSSGNLGFLDPETTDQPEFAQITRAGPDAELTEWVRYDEIDVARGQLVRSDPRFLHAARAAAVGEMFVVGGDLPDLVPDPPNSSPPDDDDDDDDGPGPGGGGGTGGGGGGAGAGGGGGKHPGGPPPDPSQGSGFSYWSPELRPASSGESIEALPVSRAVASSLRFRGVAGTASNAHPPGTTVLPVFRLDGAATEDQGWPGWMDRAFLVGDDARDPGHEVTVQHVHRPLNFRQHEWDEDPGNLFAPARADGKSRAVAHPEEITDYTYLAFSAASPFTLIPSGGTGGVDARVVPRLVKYPSGELPRVVSSVRVGGAVVGGGNVPTALVDELVFGDTRIPSGLSGGAGRGGSFRLAQAATATDGQLVLAKGTLTRAMAFSGNDFPSELPANAGLLRVGQEVVCYEGGAANGLVLLAGAGGRGLLGTDPQPHQPGEPVSFLEGWTVSTLTSAVTGESAGLPLLDTSAFPPRGGTVLVGGELVHYTRVRGGALEMPQASDEPGADDADGPGLFRGRYGTPPTGHAAGTPVVLWPFRYWDRWAERADAPELAYFGFELAQPGAYWTSVFWKDEAPGHAGAVLGVLQRTDPDVAWDADPATTAGLDLLWTGMPREGANPIGAQSDRVEWRVFVRYQPGAFDPVTGLSHGWKESPVLRLFGTEYLAPGHVLRSLER